MCAHRTPPTGLTGTSTTPATSWSNGRQTARSLTSASTTWGSYVYGHDQGEPATLITEFKSSGDVILLTSNPHQSLAFTALNQAKYELAISNDIPLIAIYDRFTSYAVSNPLGYFNDAAHPSAAGYADKELTICRSIA